ncbi:unnamed protein product [Candidula unifasciata]|uniref:Aquaporin n=1 Tax=Candidula unifasciata TaxID=100452 RepID=A0A8S3YIJ0_9EUPU|nr:unnamed protein product [Candidula unifasciata]
MIQTGRVFLGLHELRTVRFYKGLMCEFLGGCILIVCGCGASLTMEAGKPPSTVTRAFVAGMTIANIVWTLNHVSGSHNNPVITFAFMISGIVSVTKTIGYIIAQCLGTMTGAAVVWFLVPPSWRGNLGSTVFHEDVTLVQGFFIEFISTFILMMGVFATADRYRTDHSGSLPLTIGLIIFMSNAWAGKLTGCSMNPARSFGPAVVSGSWNHHWVYWVAPFAGSTFGSQLYRYALAESPQEADTSIHVNRRDPHHKKPSYLRKFTDKTIVIEATPTQL